MTLCPDCGEQTPRRGRCRQCAIIHIHEEADQPELDDREAGYECTSCGNHYITDGSEACPNCGARRRRYLGDVVTDGGQPDEGGHISKPTCGISQRELLWTLDRLALGFESADPHIRHEAKMVALQNFRGFSARLVE